MEVLVPKYRRNPNEKVESLYWGVAPGIAGGARTVTSLVKPTEDRNHLEATRAYGPGLERGQGGQIAVLVLGGMETTLDEMEYILEARKAQSLQVRRKEWEIADMCRVLADYRNERIEAARELVKANPSMAKPVRKRRFYLPSGCRLADTPEPGFKILVRALR